MRKSLGSKRKELSAEHIEEITKLFGDFEEAEKDGKPISKIFKNEDFGYRTITVEQNQRATASRQQLEGYGERASVRRRGDLLRARGAAARA